MSTPLFPAFPDEARLWIYAAERSLTAREQAEVLERLQPFLARWSSHGRPVRGAAVFLHDRFLAVAGHLPAGDLSGCGIDASVHHIEAAIAPLATAWAPALTVFYRDDDGTVRSAERREFRRLVREGHIHAETPVFDLSLTSVGELRRGRFEQPAGQSWHATVFRIPVA
ncbi:hypothetical protein GQ464_015670 [Rhodocaloribacter litoris]|uniref:hypothetical protein n=1 Tax=Rhodocaloribacter litoris TaxID=2558931 RepID=UPI00141F9818|nr:hypothetical protein [Rhodocaloribacter litoris]QXD14840.1 hypothetical protein GQ464_015670 [Rhodocaloribacter litoris]